MELIPKDEVLKDIDNLMKSPWFLDGKTSLNPIAHTMYMGRKEGVEIVRDMVIKAVQPMTLDTPFCPYCGAKRGGE